MNIEVTAEEEGSWIEFKLNKAFKLDCDKGLDDKHTETESFEGHIHKMRKKAQLSKNKNVLDKIAKIKGEYSQDDLLREITSQKQEGSSAAQD